MYIPVVFGFNISTDFFNNFYTFTFAPYVNVFGAVFLPMLFTVFIGYAHIIRKNSKITLGLIVVFMGLYTMVWNSIPEISIMLFIVCVLSLSTLIYKVLVSKEG